jgi:hypothetical protein
MHSFCNRTQEISQKDLCILLCQIKFSFENSTKSPTLKIFYVPKMSLIELYCINIIFILGIVVFFG